MKRFILAAIFLLGLLYVLPPGPSSRSQIPDLPGSVKSVEPGDTTQNPNNAGYYSDHRRNFITAFYYSAFRNLDPIGKLIPPIKLNYPPEDAFIYVRDQEKSTFLEEYIYPLRETIFVNGFEPLVKNGRAISHDADFVIADGKYYNSKTVIRIYPSSLASRVFVYLGVWASFYMIFFISKKIFKGESL
jgi:hypothetical protein